MRQSLQHFGIIGGGAWGTALGMALVRAGRDVTLWAREPEVVDSINAGHENEVFLPGIRLDPRLKAVHGLNDLASCDAWLLVVPTQHLRETCRQLALACPESKAPLVVTAKGIEQGTLSFPVMIAVESFPSHPFALLSGPTFAAEVAQGQPAAATLACIDADLGLHLAEAMSSRTFRLYQSGDFTGTQLGGAIKNVLAIACGIAAGCGMGENARAALITRGLAEMMRLANAMGAHRETLMGLSGLGDLVLTCSSPQSRNMALGMALGQGKALADILAGRRSVAEGVTTAAAALALARKHNVDMPLVEAVDAILNQGAGVTETIETLLARPLRPENR